MLQGPWRQDEIAQGSWLKERVLRGPWRQKWIAQGSLLKEWVLRELGGRRGSRKGSGVQRRCRDLNPALFSYCPASVRIHDMRFTDGKCASVGQVEGESKQ
jgi:hypothetical protein